MFINKYLKNLKDILICLNLNHKQIYNNNNNNNNNNEMFHFFIILKLNFKIRKESVNNLIK